MKNTDEEGKLFSIDILDSADGEICCIFFNEAAVKFNEVLVMGSVYAFSNGTIKADS